MSSNEIPNLCNFLVSFTSANPPVIVSRSANVERVSRSAAGTYLVELVNKIPTGGLLAPGVQLRAASQLASAASFASAIEAAGDVVVTVRNLAGDLADTAGRIDVEALNYPTLA